MISQAIDTGSFDATLASCKGKRIVVKLGGEVMLNSAGLEAIAEDVALLARHGAHPVIAHGGGPQADTLSKQLGHTVRKVAGRRITDDDALEVAKMVYGGSINIELVAALKRHGAKAVGLSGADGELITVARRPLTRASDPAMDKAEWVDFGHVGDITSVDTTLLELLLNAGYVPVIASLAADKEGNLYNINADTVACALAERLKSDSLFIMTNVPGILRKPDDSSTLLAVCAADEAAALIKSGAISGGMLPKVHNCLQALEEGVKEVHILDGTAEQSLLLPALAGMPVGTVMHEGLAANF